MECRLRIERNIRENAQDCPAASGAIFCSFRGLKNRGYDVQGGAWQTHTCP